MWTGKRSILFYIFSFVFLYDFVDRSPVVPYDIFLTSAKFGGRSVLEKAMHLTS